MNVHQRITSCQPLGPSISPILCINSPGFITERLGSCFHLQSENEDDIYDVDRAFIFPTISNNVIQLMLSLNPHQLHEKGVARL